MTLPAFLSLLHKLDHWVRESEDETALALQFTSELAEFLDADLAVLALPGDPEFGEVDLRTVSDRAQLLTHLPAAALEQAIRTIHDSGSTEPIALELPLPGVLTLPAAGIQLAARHGQTGVWLMARHSAPFNEEQLVWLEAAARRLESAVANHHLEMHLAQEALVMRTVLRIDRIRDSSTSLDDLVNRTLAEVFQVIPAEAGFILLFDRSGRRLEMRSVSEHSRLTQPDVIEQVQQVAEAAIHQARAVHQGFSGGELRAVLGVPLVLEDRVVGVLGVVNRHELPRFTPAEETLLSAIGSQIDTAIFERLQTQRLREAFGRSVGPHVMERLLQIEDRDLLKGERVEVTALFSDMRGFTRHTEHTPPDVLERMVNQHFQAIVQAVLAQDGMVDKFIGDGLFALFNAPVRQADFPLRAVRAAIAMQKAHQQVMAEWAKERLPQIPIGIGIATGEAVVGSFGSTAHAEYTAVGSSINLAARLCARCVPDGIWVDQRTYQLVLPHIKTAFPLMPMRLKGFSQPIKAWDIVSITE